MRLVQISQGQNRLADSLATIASSLTNEVPQLIRVEVVNVSTIMVSEPCWMDPIIEFLANDCIPNDEKEVERIHRIAARFWLSEDCMLYQRSFGGPYLLCLHPSKVDELLTKLHKGVCGRHVGGCLLAHRVMTQGFWWPKMQRDATNHVWKRAVSEACPVDT